MAERKSSKLSNKILLAKFIILVFLGTSFGKLLDKVVASVNGEPILLSDIKMAEIYYGIHDRNEALNKLIEVNLFYQYLVQKGVHISDEKVDELVKEIAKNNGMSLEELVKELDRYGLTLRDFKELLKKDLIATAGLREYLLRNLKISEVELEMAKLKRGLLKIKRKIELVSVPKERARELESLFTDVNVELKKLAEEVGGSYQVLSVEKGDLIKELDQRVWKARKGELIFAEDDRNIYIIRVLGEEKSSDDTEEEKLKREILAKKLKEEYQKLREKLFDSSIISIIER